jgi:hypothetical protein
MFGICERSHEVSAVMTTKNIFIRWISVSNSFNTRIIFNYLLSNTQWYITYTCGTLSNWQKASHRPLNVEVSFPMALPVHSEPWPVYSFRNNFSQMVGLLGRVISPSRGRYLNTGQHKHKLTHTDIHASSGIRTHDPSVLASEDTSCLRLRGYCDRLNVEVK